MDEQDLLFGEVAVELRLMTREQVAVCVHQQQAQGGTRRIGELAADLGYMSDEQVGMALAQQMRVMSQRRQSAPAVPEPRAAAPQPAFDAGSAPKASAPKASAPMVGFDLASEPPPLLSPSEPSRRQAKPAKHAEPAKPVEPAKAAEPARKPSAKRGRATLTGKTDWQNPEASGWRSPSRPPEAPTSPSFDAASAPEPDPSFGAAPAAAPSFEQAANVPPAAPVPKEAPPMQAAPAQPAPAEPERAEKPPAAFDLMAAFDELRPSAHPGPSDAKVGGPIGLPTPPPEAPEDAQRPKRVSPKDTYLGKALAMALAQGASDLHVHTGAPVMMRVNGVLVPLSAETRLTPGNAQSAIAEILTEAQWQQLSDDGEIDFALEIRKLGRFRVNAYRQQRGMDIVLRLIPPQAPTMERLGLPERLEKLVDYRTGMVLCTGPAGCGKSTTLAALLNILVGKRRDHILTIENPVEHVMPAGLALVNQRQVGDHTSSFSRALRAALREDPDIIAITELRDRETMSLAITAAETGHLVLGTLHTGSAGQTINRIVSSFPAEEQAQIRVMLSESLRAVVSQRLVPRADGQGRVPAIELLMVNTAVSNVIRDDKTYQLPSVMQTGKAAGMITLDDSLHELVKTGTVTKEEAARFATKKERFK